MTNAAAHTLTVLLCCCAIGANAATEQLSETGYDVTIRPGDKITLANGNVVMTNAQSHESIVNDKTGEQSSEWCNFDSLLDQKGALVQYVGYCTRIHDNGDLMWSSFTGTTAEAPSPFTIIGGTGRFSGAAGGGITNTTSTRGDGLGTTFKNVGTLTVK